MNGRRVELALWIAAAALLLTAGLGARRSALGNKGGMGEIIPPVPAVAERRAPSAETSSSISASDPFRLERHPSPIAYRPELEGVAAPPAPPKPPKPVLVLAGILGGPPWEALIEGIPDHTGAVLVREGDVVAGLKIRSVRSDSVIIHGADTTWRLGIKRSWQ